MSDFLHFIDTLAKDFPIHVIISYNKTFDWSIRIYKRGCADDYPNSAHYCGDVILCSVNECDMELCFAKAQCEVKKWLLENRGGY